MFRRASMNPTTVLSLPIVVEAGSVCDDIWPTSSRNPGAVNVSRSMRMRSAAKSRKSSNAFSVP